MKRIPFSTKLYTVGGLVILIVILFGMFFSSPVEKNKSTLFGALQLKAESSEMVSRDQEEEANSLRYKVRVKKENPFLALYKEEHTQKAKPVNKPKVAPVKKEPKRGFFSVSNGHGQSATTFFKAIFKERQAVQPGKALCMVLQEPIPALGLKVGTVLKGIPHLAQERILIKITAGVSDSGIKRVSLVCYDREDLLEGLYYDSPSNQLEDDIKESLIDEALELDFKGRELTKKGVAIARKYKSIYLEKGREVLLAFPEQQEQDK